MKVEKEIADALSAHLKEVESYWSVPVKVTLLIRIPSMKMCDVLMSNEDDLRDSLKAIEVLRNQDLKESMN